MRRINQSWRDEQATHNYPFDDSASPTVGDSRVLPTGAILDALIHPANSQGGYYLESIEISGNSIQFNVFDDTNTPVATGQWDSTLPDLDVVPLSDLEGRRAGLLVVKSDVLFVLVNEWGDGVHGFEVDTARFVPSTWEYAIVADDPQDLNGVPILSQEDLYLVAEDGIRLECQEGEDETRIVVHAVGDPLSRRSDCGDVFVVPRFIRQLVFQHGPQTVQCSPGDIGNSLVVVTSRENEESALRIKSTPGVIKLGFMASKQ